MNKILVSAMIKNKDNNYLSLKLKKLVVKGDYLLPGGKVEDNETARDALIRELKEELDIVIQIDSLAGIVEEKFDDGYWVVILFNASIKSGEIKIQEKDKIECFEWVSFDKLRHSKNYILRNVK